MTPTRVELFYDIVSPYSYLAFTCFERYRERWALDLVLRPAFLGGVLKAVGNVPPASLPQRAPYLVRDLGRLSGYFDVELIVPDEFPGNTLSTMRFFAAAERADKSVLPALTRAFFRRHWGKGKAVNTPETILELAAPIVGEARAQEWLAQSSTPEVKDHLKKMSDEAVERGAYGFPTFYVQKDGSDEMYFGSDRLSLFAHEHNLPWDGPVPRPSPL